MLIVLYALNGKLQSLPMEVQDTGIIRFPRIKSVALGNPPELSPKTINFTDSGRVVETSKGIARIFEMEE